MTRAELIASMAGYVTHRNGAGYSVLGDYSAECALKAIEQAGFAVVPVDPTVEMEVAGTEQWLRELATEERARANYLAMIEEGKIQ